MVKSQKFLRFPTIPHRKVLSFWISELLSPKQLIIYHFRSRSDITSGNWFGDKPESFDHIKNRYIVEHIIWRTMFFLGTFLVQFLQEPPFTSKNNLCQRYFWPYKVQANIFFFSNSKNYFLILNSWKFEFDAFFKSSCCLFSASGTLQNIQCPGICLKLWVANRKGIFKHL